MTSEALESCLINKENHLMSLFYQNKDIILKINSKISNKELCTLYGSQIDIDSSYIEKPKIEQYGLLKEKLESSDCQIKENETHLILNIDDEDIYISKINNEENVNILSSLLPSLKSLSDIKMEETIILNGNFEEYAQKNELETSQRTFTSSAMANSLCSQGEDFIKKKNENGFTNNYCNNNGSIIRKNEQCEDKKDYKENKIISETIILEDDDKMFVNKYQGELYCEENDIFFKESNNQNFAFDYEKNFKSPLVFNMSLEKSGKFFIKMFFKEKKYNYITTCNVLGTLLIAKYDKNKNIINLYCKCGFKEHEFISENLEDGNYVIWIYLDFSQIKEENLEYNIQFMSIKKIYTEYVGLDENFALINQLIFSNYKIIGKNNIESSNNFFIGELRELINAGLYCVLLYNKKSDKWLEVTVDMSNLTNLDIFPPFENKKRCINVLIPPNSHECLIGIKKSNKKVNFILNFNISIISKNEEVPKIENPFDIYLKGKINMSQNGVSLPKSISLLNKSNKNKINENKLGHTSIIIESDEIFKYHEEQKTLKDFDEKVSFYMSKEEDSFMMQQILDIPLEGEVENLQNSFLDDKKEKRYLGGYDENFNKSGRGCIFNANSYLVGRFKDDEPFGEFRIFKKNKQIIFIGNITKDYKLGDYGTIHIDKGGKYKGHFNKKHHFHGTGTYFFPEGTSWSGNFNDGALNGEGKCYYDRGFISEILTYNQNKLVSKKNLGRDDFSSEGSENFFWNLKITYPEIAYRILVIPPYRDFSDMLTWTIKFLKYGKKYIGQIKKDGTMHGKGCIIYPSGRERYYIGYLENNEFSKFGRFYDEKFNIIFEGKFKNNIKHGYGIEKYENGNMYHGFYANDKPNGLGVFYFSNGSKFEGKFKNGERHGRGCLIDKDLESKQIIEYNNSDVVSQGELIIPDPEKSVKEEEDLIKSYPLNAKLFLSLPETKESKLLSKKSMQTIKGFYIGEVNSIGFKHGRGTLTKPNSSQFIVANFIDDFIEGEGTIYYKENKPMYIGEFKHNIMMGKGKYFKEEGDIIEGIFNEAGEGDGTCTFTDGSKWMGHFYGLNLNGKGDYYDSKGVFCGIKEYKFNHLINSE